MARKPILPVGDVANMPFMCKKEDAQHVDLEKPANLSISTGINTNRNPKGIYIIFNITSAAYSNIE